jgi:hypothetical protein
MCDPSVEPWWDEFSDLMAQIESADEPYWLSVNNGGLLVEPMVDSVVATSLYLIWRSLEDMYDVRPDERSEANGVMRSGAREWLAVKDDDAARSRYLDHWRYDVCGYERHPLPP